MALDDPIRPMGAMNGPRPEVVTSVLDGDPLSLPEDVRRGEEKADENPDAIIRRVEKMLHDGRNGKNVLLPRDAANLPLYNGDRVDDYRRALWATQIRFNPFKNTVDTELSIEADQDVNISIQGKGGPESELRAAFAEAVIRDHWEKSGMREKRLTIRKWSLITGSSVAMPLWRPATDKYPARNHIEIVDIRMCLFDPDSTTNEELQESGWFIRFRWMTKAEILKVWPTDEGGKPTTERLKSIRPVSYKAQATSSYSELPLDIIQSDPAQQYDYEREIPDHYLVIEAWYHDDAEDVLPIIGMSPETGLPTIEGLKRVPKYPTGRFSVILLSSGGRALLYDGPNQYDFFPVVMFTDTTDLSRLYGIPLLKNVRWLGKLMNDIAGAIADSLKQCGYPRLKVNRLVGPDIRTISNAPGEIYQCKGNLSEAIEFMAPPVLPQEWWRLLDIAMRWYQDSTGHYDAVLGRKPPSVVSGKSIEALQQVGLQRPREQVRAQNRGFELLARMMLQNLVTFGGDDPRWITIAGEDGKRLLDYVESSRQQEIARQQAMNPMFQPTPETGMPPFLAGVTQTTIPGAEQAASTHLQWIPEMLKVWDLDFKIEAGVSLIESKIERAQQFLELFKLRDEQGLPPVDTEAILKALNVPGREAILERIRARGDALTQLKQIRPMFDAAVQALQQGGIPLPWEQNPQAQPQQTA